MQQTPPFIQIYHWGRLDNHTGPNDPSWIFMELSLQHYLVLSPSYGSCLHFKMQLQELLWTMRIFGFTKYVLSNFLSSCSLSLIRTWGIHPLETHDIGETMGECLLPSNQTKWAITWRIGGLEAEALHPPAMAPRPLFFAPLLGFRVPPASGSHRSPAGR